MASTDGSVVNLVGSLNSSANDYFRIEFFASASANATGYGEGQIYLGSTNVVTNGSGNASFGLSLGAAVPVGYVISATATRSVAVMAASPTPQSSRRAWPPWPRPQGCWWWTRPTTTADGDTTSITTLLGNKGADAHLAARKPSPPPTTPPTWAARPTPSTSALPAQACHTITLATALPDITEGVVINASTDDSFAANGNKPAVVLDGNGLVASGLTPDQHRRRLRPCAAWSSPTSPKDGGSTVGHGIDIQAGSDGNTVAGNYIGQLNSSGTAGTNTVALSGIYVAGANNTLGGLTAADRNVLSGAAERGLLIEGGTASNNLVLGNYIGTRRDWPGGHRQRPMGH
jgi:hypothetical protein